jgi:uncharacterized protein (TIGR04255 family)
MTNAPTGATKERIKFENPPIIELVVSLFHMPIPELKAQHIGIYWDRVREKYPLCQQQSIVVNPFDPQPQPLQPLMEAPGEIFPLPRFWFLSNEHPTLIQMQRNAFMLNWRRLPNAMPSEYPHYESVVAEFWKELMGYEKFLQDTVGGKLDPIQRCELTYVNLITPNEVFANQGQLMNVLPPVASFYDIQTDDRQLAVEEGRCLLRFRRRSGPAHAEASARKRSRDFVAHRRICYPHAPWQHVQRSN